MKDYEGYSSEEITYPENKIRNFEWYASLLRRCMMRRQLMNAVLLSFIALLFFNSCENNPIQSNDTVPEVSTYGVSGITKTSATCGGNVTSDGGATVTARGVCWSTSQTPTISDNKTIDGSGTGTFTSSITGLIGSTTYYVRAYATSSEGTGYGDIKSFTTKKALQTGTMQDNDGNTYKTVKIGNQWWMAENLKVTHYQNGEEIPYLQTDNDWEASNDGARCAANNDPTTVDTYGYLYNWYALNDSRSIATAGWHVPSDDEWKELEMYLGMSQSDADDLFWRGTDEGAKLKEAGSVHWETPNDATNESGFCALPAGLRDYDGSYRSSLHLLGLYWTATEASPNWISNAGFYRELNYAIPTIYRQAIDKRYGYSVRLVKN